MRRSILTATAALLLAAPALEAQEFGARLGTVTRGGRVTFEPAGPGILTDALDPAVHKWYVPQELYVEYQWRQREYSNYSRRQYQRYVSTALEGEYFYDVYGNYLTRGWLIYDWRQRNPQPFGSTLEKSFLFSAWFNNLVVAADHKGQYNYAITLGSQIRTTLTPMTFSKPLFNGVQWDFASDKYEATVLMSRVSAPNSSGFAGEARTNNTNLLGGRVVAQVGDFARIGGTYVNSHHSQSQLEAVNGDIFQGQLTEAMNFAPVTEIAVLIKDDSPEDSEGGGAFFSSDILIRDVEGNEVRGSEIGFRPFVDGGFERRGYLSADGTEEIQLRYDFTDVSYIGPSATDIERVQIELVVANDYLIEISSDRQYNDREQRVFLPAAQAAGNVKDGSNQRVIAIDYGLPTANQIAGFTIEVADLHGFKGYAEFDVNHQFRQFPNPGLKTHHSASTQALAWMVNVSKTALPWFAFVELFSVSPRYSTSFVTSDERGVLDFGNDFELYEMVEDNDDQDRRPDWRRKGWGAGDEEVFPGWDENNDFISDFNQNDNEDRPNLIPDYEEPFLRFHADRPEFLYGVDMNHNAVIDRFENDEEPDYPYKRNREGFNLFGGANLGPDSRLMAGRMQMDQLSDDRVTEASYLTLAGERDHPLWGRLLVFQDLRRVRDTITDDLLQWRQPAGTRGALQLVEDRLPARNTWINTTWLGLNQGVPGGISLTHKLKWQWYHQLDDDLELRINGTRRDGSFLGLINKAEYALEFGDWTLVPRWKSEFRRQVPVFSDEFKRRELTELFMAMLRFPVMDKSFVELGFEYEIFRQLRDPPPPDSEDSSTGLTTAVQLRNASAYMGYDLMTTFGFELVRTDPKGLRPEVTTRSFITIYAGVQL